MFVLCRGVSGGLRINSSISSCGCGKSQLREYTEGWRVASTWLLNTILRSLICHNGKSLHSIDLRHRPTVDVYRLQAYDNDADVCLYSSDRVMCMNVHESSFFKEHKASFQLKKKHFEKPHDHEHPILNQKF